ASAAHAPERFADAAIEGRSFRHAQFTLRARRRTLRAMKAKRRSPAASADALAAAIGEQYDTTEYPSHPFASTHPNRLGVLAFLNGMRPQPFSGCRVLEVGCNEGANLVSIALSSPGSELVGVDIARKPVERGRAQVEALGLANVRLVEADLRDVDASYG